MTTATNSPQNYLSCVYILVTTACLFAGGAAQRPELRRGHIPVELSVCTERHSLHAVSWHAALVGFDTSFVCPADLQACRIADTK